VTVIIALFIASKFFVVGVLLAIWAVAATLLVPLVRASAHMFGNPRLRKHQGNIAIVLFGLAVALGGFLVFVPMPYHSHVEGVLWLPEQAIVRAAANGFVADFLVRPGTRVEKGTPLVQCYELALDTQLRQGEGKVAELEAEYSVAYATDRAKAQIVAEKLGSERANLALIRSRVSDLLVRANDDGVLVLPQMADMKGRFFRKGEQMGYVLGDVRPVVRVVVPQNAVDKVRSATDNVSIRVADRPSVVINGRVLREVPAGADMLPSLALSIEGGGEIATDPREVKGPKALERMFQFDLQLDDSTRIEYFGQRAFVRFNHHKEPLLVQWYRSLRLLFLSSFNV